MGNRFRLAVLNSHPIQYFAPLYAHVNRGDAVEITALYCSDSSLRGGLDTGFAQAVTWDVDLLAGYPHVFLGPRSKQRVPGGFWSLVCPEVWREVRSGRYDGLLLHGYAYAVNVIAFLAAKSAGIPVFMRSETHLGLARAPLRRWLRDSALSVAYRFVDGFMAIGRANRDYYRSLGVHEGRIHDVPYTVDNTRFKAASELSDQERDQLRVGFGVPPGMPLVLYASKFMRRKHPDAVIQAMKILQGEDVQASLLLVGSGAMERSLRELVERSGVKNVAFGGFVNQSELPRIFGAADVFVLPAENEPWGLVVNEAMCAGLPVIVGSRIGCAADLVAPGENGFLVPAGDARSLADALGRVLRDPALRKRMGARSLARIGEWDYRRASAGIAAAVAAIGAPACCARC